MLLLLQLVLLLVQLGLLLLLVLQPLLTDPLSRCLLLQLLWLLLLLLLQLVLLLVQLGLLLLLVLQSFLTDTSSRCWWQGSESIHCHLCRCTGSNHM